MRDQMDRELPVKQKSQYGDGRGTNDRTRSHDRGAPRITGIPNSLCDIAQWGVQGSQGVGGRGGHRILLCRRRCMGGQREQNPRSGTPDECVCERHKQLGQAQQCGI